MYLVAVSLLASCVSCTKDDDGKEPDRGGSAEHVVYKDGITRISDDSLAFVLYAPGKSTVHLIGDFNNWQATDTYKMRKDGDRFRLSIGGLDKTKSYICQYLIDNAIRIADPYTNQVADPEYDAQIPAGIYPGLPSYPVGKTTEIAMVVSTRTDAYAWKTAPYTVKRKEDLVIYELLIRDFTEERSIKAVKAKLPYLKSLGVNAIELMPFNEFEGNDSWGYNPSFYFATDKAYGTPADYKSFIDECHANGMAVIMDMVLNHSYGQSPLVRMYQDGAGKVTANNPWYNVTSPNTTYSWGYDFNHESQYTQQLVDSVCSYWMTHYRIDGFRFDFTKGFTNKGGDGWAYDESRINILKRMTSEIWKRNPDAIVIFEHLADNAEEKALSDYGILLWGNLNYRMNEATMGWTQKNTDNSWNSDISWGSYLNRGWSQPNLVAYMESHDEERLMYKNKAYGKEYMGYNVKQLSTGLQRTGAAAVILFSLPGPKMIWQFGELGYDYFLGSSMEEGRLEKKPIRWDYYDDPDRQALFDVFASMIRLRQTHPAFTTADYLIDLKEPFKYITLKSAGQSSAQTICAVANFDVVTQTKTVNFTQSAHWKDYFSSHELTTTGTTADVELQPGEYRLYMSD